MLGRGRRDSPLVDYYDILTKPIGVGVSRGAGQSVPPDIRSQRLAHIIPIMSHRLASI